MRKTSLTLIIIFIVGLPISGYSSCKQKKWPHSRKLTVPQMKLTLDKIPRDEIIQYLVYEIRRPRTDHLATPLLAYLIGSDSSSFNRGFYKTLSMMAFGEKADVLKDLKKWPKRRKIRKNRSIASESCKLYKKFQNSPKKGKQ